MPGIRTVKDIQLKFMHSGEKAAHVAKKTASPTELNANSYWWKGLSWKQLEQNR